LDHGYIVANDLLEPEVADGLRFRNKERPCHKQQNDTATPNYPSERQHMSAATMALGGNCDSPFWPTDPYVWLALLLACLSLLLKLTT
jgi:hypothetical protein